MEHPAMPPRAVSYPALGAAAPASAFAVETDACKAIIVWCCSSWAVVGRMCSPRVIWSFSCSLSFLIVMSCCCIMDIRDAIVARLISGAGCGMRLAASAWRWFVSSVCVGAGDTG